MQPDLERMAVTEPLCADRVGMARLAKMAFDGNDLRPLWRGLIGKLVDGTAEAGEGLDLSLIAQLLGDKPAGLAIQREVLASHQLFRSPCAARQPRLRVLALAAATDMGSNTPIEFLLEESGIELLMLYVIPEVELPAPLPDHDVAIVIASDSEDCRDALRKIDEAAARWPRPLLNPPRLVGNLDRDKLHQLLRGIEGLDIPATVAVTRAQLSDVARVGRLRFAAIAAELEFPLIVAAARFACGRWPCQARRSRRARPISGGARGSRNSSSSRFVNYASEDGLFRKYRVVFVDGRPYACHMAIADRWDIWYLNAGMSDSAAKRLEEETFMRTFDIGFRPTSSARAGGARRTDRARLFHHRLRRDERRSLLIFEADNTAVVHNMDPPGVSYKAPHMRKIFDAFAAMLYLRARLGQENAA